MKLTEDIKIILILIGAFLISFLVSYLIYYFFHINFNKETIYWLTSTIIQALVTLLAISVPLGLYLIKQINKEFMEQWPKKEKIEIIKNGKIQPKEIKKLNDFLKETEELKRKFANKWRLYRESFRLPIILIISTIVVALVYLPLGGISLNTNFLPQIIIVIIYAVAIYVLILTLLCIFALGVAMLKFLIPPDTLTKED